MKTTFKVLFLIVLFLYGCGNQESPTGGPEDTEKPAILNVFPSEFDDITGKNIEIDFSKQMDQSSFVTGIYIYPPIMGRRFKMDANKLIIEISEELLPNTNYFFSFTEKIKGIHNNQLDKQYDFTYSSGILNENRISGSFTYEDEKDKNKDIRLSLFSADTTLIKTIIVNERYDLETLNNENHTIRAFIDLNSNSKLETEKEPFAKAVVEPKLFSRVDLHMAYQDSTAPEASRIMKRFTDEYDIVFDEELINIKSININTDDSLKTAQQIKRWRIKDKEIKIFTEPLDTLEYILYAKGAADKKNNFSDIDSLEFKGITKIDTIPPEVVSIKPRNGSSVTSLKPEIKITFNEVLFREDVEAWLIEAETGDQFQLKSVEGDSETHTFQVTEELNNFNSYNIQLKAKDPRGNELKEFEGSVFLPIVRN